MEDSDESCCKLNLFLADFDSNYDDDGRPNPSKGIRPQKDNQSTMEEESDSDDSLAELNLFLTDFESEFNQKSDREDPSELVDPPKEEVVQMMSVNQRKVSRSEMTHFEKGLDQKTINYKAKWKQISSKLATIQDPWEDFPDIEVKEVTRYRYSPDTNKWTVDHIQVKMEDKPFSHGSMRECFRLKCLTNFTKCKDWRNCVAKRYLDFANVETYKNDVIMQAVAKRWSEMYNRANPPKKIDMVQLNMIEFNQENRFYHIEPFIMGDYVKYNSNCGFVNKCKRNTPQAFSHFTFEKSGHKLMVVDIQGVDDLYTDPQIHTHDLGQFGDGNLGIRGMALFFQSHVCSSICVALGLENFDLTDSELDRNQHSYVIGTPLTVASLDRDLSNSESSALKDGYLVCSPVKNKFLNVNRPMCNLSECSGDENDSSHVTYLGSNSTNEANLIDNGTEVSVLSKIHHQLALYHQMGRFTDSSVDWIAYDFHENIAAKLGNPEAMENLSKIYLDLMITDFKLNDILNPQRTLEDLKNLGVEFMIRCAETFGSLFCLRHVAHCWLEGSGPGKLSERNWRRAADCLETLIMSGTEEFYEETHLQLFRERVELAKVYMVGGFGVDVDKRRAGQLFTEAANEAIKINYVELAMKYFSLAEECQVEEQ